MGAARPYQSVEVISNVDAERPAVRCPVAWLGLIVSKLTQIESSRLAILDAQCSENVVPTILEAQPPQMDFVSALIQLAEILRIVAFFGTRLDLLAHALQHRFRQGSFHGSVALSNETVVIVGHRCCHQILKDGLRCLVGSASAERVASIAAAMIVGVMSLFILVGFLSWIDVVVCFEA